MVKLVSHAKIMMRGIWHLRKHCFVRRRIPRRAYDITKITLTSPARVWIYLEKNYKRKIKKAYYWSKETEGNCSFKNPADNFWCNYLSNALISEIRQEPLRAQTWWYEPTFCIYVSLPQELLIYGVLCHRAEWNSLACEGSLLKLHYPYFYRLYFVLFSAKILILFKCFKVILLALCRQYQVLPLVKPLGKSWFFYIRENLYSRTTKGFHATFFNLNEPAGLIRTLKLKLACCSNSAFQQWPWAI